MKGEETTSCFEYPKEGRKEGIKKGRKEEWKK